jgi:hypothetical protein
MPPSKKNRKGRPKTKNEDTHAADVRWCIENKENLTFPLFADHFGLSEMRFAYNRYNRILEKYLKDKSLEEDFATWNNSPSAEEYWTSRTHKATIKRSRRQAAQHIQKTVTNEYLQLEKLNNEGSISVTSSTGSDYAESQKKVHYKLTFDELGNNSLKTPKSTYLLSEDQKDFKKRVALSSITILPVDKLSVLNRHSLNDDCYRMVRSFKSAVEEGNNAITADLGQFSDGLSHFIYCILTYALNIINIDRRQQAQQQQVLELRKSEPNFITKYVANLIQNIAFAYSQHLVVRWDTSSCAYDGSKKKKRPDFIISTVDGCEIGCGEVKPPCSHADLVEEDLCRVPEHLKRQLHKRLEVASYEKELVTFGFF